jgi:hypothetical protein
MSSEREIWADSRPGVPNSVGIYVAASRSLLSPKSNCASSRSIHAMRVSTMIYFYPFEIQEEIPVKADSATASVIDWRGPSS